METLICRRENEFNRVYFLRFSKTRYMNFKILALFSTNATKTIHSYLYLWIRLVLFISPIIFHLDLFRVSRVPYVHELCPNEE